MLCKKSTCKGFKWIILDFRKRKWKTSFLLIVVNWQQVWQWVDGLNGILNTWIDETVTETSDRAKLVVYFGSRYFCSITPIGQCVDYWAGKMSWSYAANVVESYGKKERPDMPDTFQLFRKGIKKDVRQNRLGFFFFF